MTQSFLNRRETYDEKKKQIKTTNTHRLGNAKTKISVHRGHSDSCEEKRKFGVCPT